MDDRQKRFVEQLNESTNKAASISTTVFSDAGSPTLHRILTQNPEGAREYLEGQIRHVDIAIHQLSEARKRLKATADVFPFTPGTFSVPPFRHPGHAVSPAKTIKQIVEEARKESGTYLSLGTVATVPGEGPALTGEEVSVNLSNLPQGGVDLDSADRRYDAHLSLMATDESRSGRPPDEIVIDVFLSRVKDPNHAHIESMNFPNNDEGREEAIDFLSSYGFAVVFQ